MNAFTRTEITAVHLVRPQPHRTSVVELPEGQKMTYLPIVDARTAQVVGYQASSASGSEGFDCMRMQIMRSPVPDGILLVELDSRACMKSGDDCESQRFCQLFNQEAWTDRELVVYLRNSPSEFATHTMQKRLQQKGVAFAVNGDDLGLLGLDALIDARMIRFEVSILQVEGRLSAKAAQPVLHIAQKLGIQALLTGISDGEQMEQARRLGFDWLQGPLFNRLKVCS